MQIAVNKIVLLQAPEAFPDLPCPDCPDPVDGFEVAVARPNDRVERGEVLDEAADDVAGEPWDAREDAIAARLDAVVERVRLAGIAEHLGELLELEQLRVRQRGQALEHPRAPPPLTRQLLL